MSNREAIDAVPSLIAELYRIVDRLEELFPGRPFTIDGHLLGSIGEVLAAYHYGLDLSTPGAKGYDAESARVGRIEIKTTQRKSVAFRSEPPHVLVFRLHRDGTAEEVFNGPGSIIWPYVGKLGRAGARSITLAKLRSLQPQVQPDQMLPRLSRSE